MELDVTDKQGRFPVFMICCQNLIYEVDRVRHAMRDARDAGGQ
jgi:hypothetical protein